METADAPLRRVLVTDDDEGVCKLLKIVLRETCEVIVAHEAETSLGWIADGARFDAVVTDFMLPGIDGLEFVETLRRMEWAREIPIMMVSGHGPIVRDRALAVGANLVLNKPFTLKSLRAALDATFAGSAVRLIA